VDRVQEMEQLAQPLNPDLDYFDATPSMEQILEKQLELHNFIVIQLQTNNKLLLLCRDLTERVKQLEGRKTGLILPERLNS
jgi:hypothetical protein